MLNSWKSKATLRLSWKKSLSIKTVCSVQIRLFIQWPFANFFFFFNLCFFSPIFMNHRTASEGRGHYFNSFISLTSTRFKDTYTLVGWFRTHLCTQIVTGLKLGIFSFRVQIANHRVVHTLNVTATTQKGMNK